MTETSEPQENSSSEPGRGPSTRTNGTAKVALVGIAAAAAGALLFGAGVLVGSEISESDGEQHHSGGSSEYQDDDGDHHDDAGADDAGDDDGGSQGGQEDSDQPG